MTKLLKICGIGIRMIVNEIRETETYRTWYQELKDTTAKALIATRLRRLRLGLFGDVTPVGQGISELRIHYGPGYRIYFKKRGNKVIILLCGGDKSTQNKDIRMAKHLAEEWSE